MDIGFEIEVFVIVQFDGIEILIVGIVVDSDFGEGFEDGGIVLVNPVLPVTAFCVFHAFILPFGLGLSTCNLGNLWGFDPSVVQTVYKMAEIFERLWVGEHPRSALGIPSSESGDSFSTMLLNGILILIANDDFERWVLSWLERIQHHSKGQSEDAPPSAGVSLSSAMTTSASILV